MFIVSYVCPSNSCCWNHISCSMVMSFLQPMSYYDLRVQSMRWHVFVALSGLFVKIRSLRVSLFLVMWDALVNFSLAKDTADSRFIDQLFVFKSLHIRFTPYPYPSSSCCSPQTGYSDYVYHQQTFEFIRKICIMTWRIIKHNYIKIHIWGKYYIKSQIKFYMFKMLPNVN